MSRSGYSDCLDQWDLIRWRGAVASAMRGKRGQSFLHELREALDALPEPKLIAHELQCKAGVCAIGSVGAKRGIDMSDMNPENSNYIAEQFGIANAMVCEIEYMNDEAGEYQVSSNEAEDDLQRRRWRRVSAWVDKQIAALDRLSKEKP